MKTISIEGTSKTPSIKFDSIQAKLEIKGKSIPENAKEFYKPLVDTLSQYDPSFNELVEVDIQLDYFNIHSSKCILDVFKRLHAIMNHGHKVVINWYYEKGDNDILEAGEDYEAIVDMHFNMLQAL